VISPERKPVVKKQLQNADTSPATTTNSEQVLKVWTNDTRASSLPPSIHVSQTAHPWRSLQPLSLQHEDDGDGMGTQKRFMKAQDKQTAVPQQQRSTGTVSNFSPPGRQSSNDLICRASRVPAGTS
jgi:hypothetical protein